MSGHSGCDLDSEARLTDATRSYQRQEPDFLAVQEMNYAGLVLLPSDQSRGRNRQG